MDELIRRAEPVEDPLQQLAAVAGEGRTVDVPSQVLDYYVRRPGDHSVLWSRVRRWMPKRAKRGRLLGVCSCILFSLETAIVSGFFIAAAFSHGWDRLVLAFGGVAALFYGAPVLFGTGIILGIRGVRSQLPSKAAAWGLGLNVFGLIAAAIVFGWMVAAVGSR